jgi:uncharacterized repeat protein (TIGR02543 family)
MRKVFLLVIAMLATMWASAEIVQGTVRSNGLDFNNDGTCEFSWTYDNTYLTYDAENQCNIWGDEEAWDAPKPLSAGTSIGSSANWSGYGDCSIVGFGETPAIPVGQNVYIGFRIEYSDGLHYGWGLVSISGSDYSYTANWQAIYYETTPNTPINAGSTGSVTPPAQYTIAVSANPSNAGNVTGGGIYTQGTSVTVSASANTGYTFVNWTENGNVVSTNSSYSFSATANRTLVANFQQNSTPSDTYTVITYSNPSNGGYTVGEWDGDNNTYIHFPAGSTVTLEAVPYTGYTFVSWTENGSVVSTNAVYTFTINSNRVIYANFSNSTFAIEENVENDLTIYSENLLVTVRCEDGANVAIYDINGRMIASEKLNGDESIFEMPSPGLYIVRVGAQVRKIVVTE